MDLCPCLFYDCVALCCWNRTGLEVNTVINIIICFWYVCTGVSSVIGTYFRVFLARMFAQLQDLT
jgi:hypothetical protein